MTNPASASHIANNWVDGRGCRNADTAAVVRMVSVAAAALPPTDGRWGLKAQEASAGSPKQLRDTAPLRPPVALMLSWHVADCPAAIATEGGEAASEML